MASGASSPLMLITGGSRGVGAACVRLAAAQGYDVAISYVSNRAVADAVDNWKKSRRPFSGWPAPTRHM